MDCPQMINFAWFCPHPMELLTCRFKESNKVFDPQSDDTGRFLPCHDISFSYVLDRYSPTTLSFYKNRVYKIIEA